MTYFVKDLESLMLLVYTIGYPEMGESQIIILTEEKTDIIHFSCVIDCYSVGKTNTTLSILKKHKIKHLDYFIWTHTDVDHSIGILDIIKNHCNPKTHFFLPEGLNGNKRDLIKYNKEVKKTFKRINSWNLGRNYNVSSVGVSEGFHNQIFNRTYSDTKGANLLTEILAIAPNSSIIRRRLNSGMINNKNDFSIATLFHIGQLCLLFSGDIENQTIRQIPEHYFKNLSYIKVPHHTSDSSNELLNKIRQTQKDYSTIPSSNTTVFLKHNLPNPQTFSEYLMLSETFNSTDTGSQPFGYIMTVFDIVNNAIIKEELFGNAKCYTL